MPREKKISLYSRNMIKIEKITNIDFSKRRDEYPYTISLSETTTYEKSAPVSYKNENGTWKDVIKKSKLGFYYKTKEYIKPVSTSEVKNKKGLTIKTITVNLDKTQYELSYPTCYLGVKINIDERPWDIAPGSKGMPEHFVDALVKEATKFFDVIFDNKITITKKQTWYNRTKETIDTKNLKKQTFIDLFGYEDGPKVQMNDIKVLSHGFDLKESFRKRKENK